MNPACGAMNLNTSFIRWRYLPLLSSALKVNWPWEFRDWGRGLLGCTDANVFTNSLGSNPPTPVSSTMLCFKKIFIIPSIPKTTIPKTPHSVHKHSSLPFLLSLCFSTRINTHALRPDSSADRSNRWTLSGGGVISDAQTHIGTSRRVFLW